MRTRYAKLALTISLVLSSPYTIAGGFQLSEHSAAGIGRANAGEAAIADSAAVIANNAAAITRFNSMQISISGAYLVPNVRVTGNGSDEGTNNQLTNNNVVDNVLVPSLYIAAPINDSWSWGIGIFSDFGASTEYPDDYLAGSIAGETTLETLNINPNIAYKLNDNFSIGLGVSAVYGQAKLTRTLGILADASNVNNGTSFERSDTAQSLEGDGVGYGFNAGLLWELNNDHRFGLSYRSNVDIDMEGDYSTFTQPGLIAKGELTLNLPSIAEFSGFHQISAPFALHYSVVMTGWDVFEEISGTVDGQEVLQKDENFENSFKYALGATYDINSSLKLRAGISYDETPNVNDVSISLPDSNRMSYSAGASYSFNDTNSLDFGFTFVDVEEVTFSEELSSELPGVSYQFRSKSDVYIYAVQYNLSF
ncbi:MAG: outer membrane protein transport protein [Moritella sp.]|uniref:outer membrane protein transport protein n=1 Tax=Moritella sp. TaxID=78556 RepID=UPI0029BB498F|nr:outer membrane protein transport protein [Moritella sp.]MDX2321687.1 outer membrane protein transport protein [Moritella sp.]